MNRVRNWIIVSAIAGLAAFATVGIPVIAATLALISFLAALAALVRHEEETDYKGKWL